MTDEKLVYSVDEAAGRLGISPSLAYAAVRRCELPAIHVGRRILISRKSLEAMLDKTQVPGD